jgi:hypothetical protein
MRGLLATRLPVIFPPFVSRLMIQFVVSVDGDE